MKKGFLSMVRERVDSCEVYMQVPSTPEYLSLKSCPGKGVDGSWPSCTNRLVRNWNASCSMGIVKVYGMVSLVMGFVVFLSSRRMPR